ncbi:MAG: hypothetical protein JWN10_368 [Solirubrobacterales bacterium]|nr:hypothetical protein [Solirubrobacterales bacterium]
MDEKILSEEMHAENATQEQEKVERENLGGSVGIKSTRCAIAPPGPVATELDCKVIVSISELYPTSKTSRLNTWKATVRLEPDTGGLTVHLEKDNNAV